MMPTSGGDKLDVSIVKQNEWRKNGSCQCLHPQRKFQQILTSLANVSKLVGLYVSRMTQALLKLLPLFWDLEWLSLWVGQALSKQSLDFPQPLRSPRHKFHWSSKLDVMGTHFTVACHRVGEPNMGLGPIGLQGDLCVHDIHPACRTSHQGCES